MLCDDEKKKNREPGARVPSIEGWTSSGDGIFRHYHPTLCISAIIAYCVPVGIDLQVKSMAQNT